MLMACTWSDYPNSTTLHTWFGCKEISGTGTGEKIFFFCYRNLDCIRFKFLIKFRLNKVMNHYCNLDHDHRNLDSPQDNNNNDAPQNLLKLKSAGKMVYNSAVMNCDRIRKSYFDPACHQSLWVGHFQGNLKDNESTFSNDTHDDWCIATHVHQVWLQKSQFKRLTGLKAQTNNSEDNQLNNYGNLELLLWPWQYNSMNQGLHSLQNCA